MSRGYEYTLLKFKIDSASSFAAALIYAEYNLRFYHLFPSFAHPIKLLLISCITRHTKDSQPSPPDVVDLFIRSDPTSEHIQIDANITELYSNTLLGRLEA
jgi:hypothetical protein